ncbi:MAG TPA: hypothetical protein PKE47_11390, partial [Verrucomicrobiota bacterium]|nr:hypothetical protein [Verrucomicrobiota bacterium]
FLRVLLGAFLGALAAALILELPGRVLRAALTLGETGGLPSVLAGMIAGVARTAFATPWGLIGALVGVAVAWRRLRRLDQPPELEEESDGSPSRFAPGETQIAFGLVLLLLALSLYPSVMVWMLGLSALAPALVLLALGTWSARSPWAGTGRLLGGFLLLLHGLAALVFAAFKGTFLSCRMWEAAYAAGRGMPGSTAPGGGELAGFLVLCVMPMALVAAGLWLWTDWPPRRRLGWAFVAFLFPIAALLLHRTMAGLGILPMTA